MERVHISIIGLTAGFLTSLSFLPQALKILRTKQVRDISLGMYIVLTVGICMWIVYGSLIKELPIILSNGIAVILCSMIIAAKIAYGRKGSE
ncbi:MAG: SemiSWEET transporter [Candidatus Omnitrophota bacterium]